jgi:hypothetical protein
MRLVIIESPWAGDIRKNRNYARKAVRDSLLRGESPIASHLLYTQAGVLKDEVPDERALGIAAGLAWAEVADAQIFYADYGFSIGMLHALKEASKAGIAVEVRYLFKRTASTRDRGRGKRKGAGQDSGAADRAVVDVVLTPSPEK